MAFTINVNGKDRTVDAPGDLALLWALRDKLGINGPKYGCGVDACKACTCLVDGKKQTVCSMSLQRAAGKKIVTIEGLAAAAPEKARVNGMHIVQQVWVEFDVAQCGFCQTGQIMAAVDLLASTNNNPTDDQIDEKMDNVCRCGTYDRIRRAIKEAGARLRTAGAAAI